MKNLFLTIAAVMLINFFNYSYADDNFSIELRPGVSYATEKISDAELKLGFGAELSFSYKFMDHLSAYAGWSYNNFAVEKSFAGKDGSFEETGYTFGFQFIYPIGDSKLNYLLRLGGTYNHLEIENNEGDITYDSGHGFGYQAEVGCVYNVSDGMSILPSIRYRSLSRDIKINNINTSVSLNYLSFGVGFSWSF